MELKRFSGMVKLPSEKSDTTHRIKRKPVERNEFVFGELALHKQLFGASEHAVALSQGYRRYAKTLPPRGTLDQQKLDYLTWRLLILSVQQQLIIQPKDSDTSANVQSEPATQDQCTETKTLGRDQPSSSTKEAQSVQAERDGRSSTSASCSSFGTTESFSQAAELDDLPICTFKPSAMVRLEDRLSDNLTGSDERCALCSTKQGDADRQDFSAPPLFSMLRRASSGLRSKSQKDTCEHHVIVKDEDQKQSSNKRRIARLRKTLSLLGQSPKQAQGLPMSADPTIRPSKCSPAATKNIEALQEDVGRMYFVF